MTKDRILLTRFHETALRTIRIALACTLLIVLSAATFSRNILWKDAINLLVDVRNKSPFKARVHGNLGRLYAKRNMPEEAEKEYSKAIVCDPMFYLAYNNMGDLYFKAGRQQEAILFFEKAISLGFSNNEDTHKELAAMYGSAGDINKAVSHFQAALLIKQTPQNYFNLGLALYKNGQTERAIDQYRSAIILDPLYAAAYLNLANAYSEKGNRSEALINYQKAVQINPRDALIYYNLGVFYKKIGDKSNATEAFKKAFEINPDLLIK